MRYLQLFVASKYIKIIAYMPIKKAGTNRQKNIWKLLNCFERDAYKLMDKQSNLLPNDIVSMSSKNLIFK